MNIKTAVVLLVGLIVISGGIVYSENRTKPEPPEKMLLQEVIKFAYFCGSHDMQNRWADALEGKKRSPYSAGDAFENFRTNNPAILRYWQ